MTRLNGELYAVMCAVNRPSLSLRLIIRLLVKDLLEIRAVEHFLLWRAAIHVYMRIKHFGATRGELDG